jgi:simple sugar transport system ATP-binding protein
MAALSSSMTGLGIETIHQDTSLAPDLSIARNLFLAREPALSESLRRSISPSCARRLRRFSTASASQLDADALVRTLSGGERQSIAISRAMKFAWRLAGTRRPAFLRR